MVGDVASVDMFTPIDPNDNPFGDVDEEEAGDADVLEQELQGEIDSISTSTLCSDAEVAIMEQFFDFSLFAPSTTMADPAAEGESVGEQVNEGVFTVDDIMAAS